MSIPFCIPGDQGCEPDIILVMKRVFVAGGTGFVGRYLLGDLVREGYEVYALVRKKSKLRFLPEGVRPVMGNPLEPGEWMEVASRCHMAINLTGANIFRRWTRAYKELLLKSRTLSTRNLGQALSPGSVLINASAVGYYGDCGEEEVTEKHPAGEDFLARLCVQWEKEALNFSTKGIRVVIARFGIVLGKGGALQKMLLPFSLGLGGPIGRGLQWFSWIHIEDLISALIFLGEKSEVEGPFNLVSPNPVRQGEFARTLARVLKRPVFLPLPKSFLRLLFGEVASVLTSSCRVIPTRLLELGFKFRFPELTPALENILG